MVDRQRVEHAIERGGVIELGHGAADLVLTIAANRSSACIVLTPSEAVDLAIDLIRQSEAIGEATDARAVDGGVR